VAKNSLQSHQKRNILAATRSITYAIANSISDESEFMSARSFFFTFTTVVVVGLPYWSSAQGDEKLANPSLQDKLAAQIETLTQQIQNSPDQLSLYSRRGDAHFFSANFTEAVTDYDKMVELDPKTDSSHWRRGIAYFYVKKYDAAAAQFNRYHSFDDVDRENGIWRYLSQYKSQGEEAARKELLKYDKDDREPFGDVYLLFAGKITGEEILDKILKAEISPSEREKRLFYATLYIGLNHAVEGNEKLAAKYLTQASKNKWPATAGYGPNYMWQVARLHLGQLEERKD
jgi:lipoprotein NlpI